MANNRDFDLLDAEKEVLMSSRDISDILRMSDEELVLLIERNYCDYEEFSARAGNIFESALRNVRDRANKPSHTPEMAKIIDIRDRLPFPRQGRAQPSKNARQSRAKWFDIASLGLKISSALRYLPAALERAFLTGVGPRVSKTLAAASFAFLIIAICLSAMAVHVVLDRDILVVEEDGVRIRSSAAPHHAVSPQQKAVVEQDDVQDLLSATQPQTVSQNQKNVSAPLPQPRPGESFESRFDAAWPDAPKPLRSEWSRIFAVPDHPGYCIEEYISQGDSDEEGPRRKLIACRADQKSSPVSKVPGNLR